jgi:hypothetical protein
MPYTQIHMSAERHLKLYSLITVFFIYETLLNEKH